MSARSIIESSSLASWFGSSKVVDENGKPLMVYHGTNAKFKKFDMKFAEDGAHFFTPNETHAGSFGTIRSFILRINSPMEIDQDTLEGAWDEEEDYGKLPRDFVEQFVIKAKKNGYDGLIIRDMSDRDISADMYLPFSSNQIREVIPESVSESDGDYPFAAENFYERVANERTSMVREFVAKKGKGIISWPRIPAEPLTRIWMVYGKRGTIFDEEGLDKIADRAMTLIARLYASTELSGHTEGDLRPEAEEDLGREFTDEEWDQFLGMLEDEKGNYLLSDFAFKRLHPLYDQLFNAKTSEQKLLILDQIFNVVHQRSDLAGVFVQGGSATLTKIANQGGYTTPEPEEKHEQRPWAYKDGD